MRKRITILGLTMIMGLAVLVGCANTSKEPDKKPEISESVQEQETTVTIVDPTDVGEEFPE
jgi:hypothetical protein